MPPSWVAPLKRNYGLTSVANGLARDGKGFSRDGSSTLENVLQSSNIAWLPSWAAPLKTVI